MKILYYSPHPVLNIMHQAGYATHINEMIKAFQNTGHKVLPLIMGGTKSNNEKYNTVSENKFKKTTKKIIPNILWETLKDIQLLKFDKYAENVLESRVLSFEPDVIYERANYMQLSGVNIANKYKIKHVLEINSPYVNERIELQGQSLLLKKALKKEKQQIEKTNLSVVVSSALQNYFAERHNISKNQFIVTPNAININSISVNNNKAQKIKQKYHIKDETLIGFVGSFFYWHRIDILIEAFSETTKYKTDIKLMIIGTGEIEDKLKKLANKLCPEKIIFTGNINREDIFTYINLFDIAVAPNANWYQSPIKIFEYGALKKAIIAPNLAPLTDIMENKKDAILIKPNVRNLQTAINELISNPNLRNKIAENFYNKIINNYTWENNVQNVLKNIN